MMRKSIWEKRPEILIEYDSKQREYYKKNRHCIYEQWKIPKGIHKAGGNFPVMVAKKYFQDRKYCVEDNFYLVRNRKKRESMEGFKRLCRIFGEQRIRRAIEKTDRIFSSRGKRVAGGDPDLFVFKNEKRFGPCFFVEVKENDQITENQKALFPILETYLCPVLIARVRCREPSHNP
jgi:hypothetical protein